MIDEKALFDAVRVIKGEALSQADVDAVNAVLHPTPSAGVPAAGMAWGAHVSPAFRDRVRQMAANLKSAATPSDYMTCMAWESGRSFSPLIKNMAGSGATGLIQFMPATAKALGTTVDALAELTAEAQLAWVEKYFLPYRGRLNNLADLYMAILWPAAVGKPDSYTLWGKGGSPTTYRQNAGLDGNKDGTITKGECAAKLYAMRTEGLRAENMG